MKKFTAVFLGSSSEMRMTQWQALDEATRNQRETAGKNAWGQWVGEHASRIVDMGSPLGKTKRVDAQGISDTKNLMTVYMVVEAESHDAAAKMFLNHPHFTIFPGEAIEIMECLPIPGQ